MTRRSLVDNIAAGPYHGWHRASRSMPWERLTLATSSREAWLMLWDLVGYAAIESGEVMVLPDGQLPEDALARAVIERQGGRLPDLRLVLRHLSQPARRVAT